jgi:hypothetical protein
MDTFSIVKESVFHAENQEPVPCGIQGTDHRTGQSRALSGFSANGTISA